MSRRSIDFYANKPRRDFINEFAKRFASRSKAVNYLIDKGIIWMKEHGEEVNPELFDHLKEAEIFQRQRDLGRAIGSRAVKRKDEKLHEIDDALERGDITEEEAKRSRTVVETDWTEERDIVLRRHRIREEEKPKKRISTEELKRRVEEVRKKKAEERFKTLSHEEHTKLWSEWLHSDSGKSYEEWLDEVLKKRKRNKRSK